MKKRRFNSRIFGSDLDSTGYGAIELLFEPNALNIKLSLKHKDSIIQINLVIGLKLKPS